MSVQTCRLINLAANLLSDLCFKHGAVLLKVVKRLLVVIINIVLLITRNCAVLITQK